MQPQGPVQGYFYLVKLTQQDDKHKISKTHYSSTNILGVLFFSYSVHNVPLFTKVFISLDVIQCSLIDDHRHNNAAASVMVFA